MLKVLVAAQQNGSPSDVIDCVSQLSTRAQLSIDCLIDTPTKLKGHQLAESATGSDWVGRFGSAVHAVQPVPTEHMARLLIGASAFVDLVVVGAAHFMKEVYQVLLEEPDQEASYSLRAPIYVPAVRPSAATHVANRVVTRVVMPSCIRLARMVTPLRQYLFEGAQIVLTSLVADSQSCKNIVSYVQAHALSAGYYALDPLEGQGLRPILREGSLLVFSVSRAGGQASRLNELALYTEEEFASLGLSFLIVP